MDSLKRFYETLLSDKEDFSSNLNMKNITDAYSKDAKKVWKTLKHFFLVINMIYTFKVKHYCLQMYLKDFEVY